MSINSENNDDFSKDEIKLLYDRILMMNIKESTNLLNMKAFTIEFSEKFIINSLILFANPSNGTLIEAINSTGYF